MVPVLRDELLQLFAADLAVQDSTLSCADSVLPGGRLHQEVDGLRLALVLVGEFTRDEAVKLGALRSCFLSCGLCISGACLRIVHLTASTLQGQSLNDV